MSFEKLKANSASSISKLVKAAEKLTENKSFGDDRLWAPTVDKAGNGYAVIRFLPAGQGEDLPWVRFWDHGFKGPSGKWYIENSLTTLGEKDPVGELNSKLWNSGSDANKEIARKQKRKLSYICNVLIVSDPKHPENEGQVRLFKFGKKIFDKIMDKARPTFEDEKPVNVFDPFEGADFKLRMRKVDGYANYDQSTFMDPTELASGDEEKMVEILNKSYKLSEFLDRKNFKSFEELTKKLSDVLDGEGTPVKSAASLSEDDNYVAPKSTATTVASKPVTVSKAAEVNDDDEDVMSYFQKIADEA